ncbi:MAG TPA: thioesterase family protein [Spirochaetota bacterium]|nr:thioesterase family protein [Spirochaetota bacterium]
MAESSHTTNVRIYYKDTDTGGVVYYAKYAEFMEMGRTELLRNIGISVQDLIDDYNIICPVAELNIKYKKSAVYDDTLKIKTSIENCSAVKIDFSYEIYNQMSELLCTGTTTNCPVDGDTLKLTRFPPEFLDKLKK